MIVKMRSTLLRRAYEKLLEFSTRGRGLKRYLDGEAFRVIPRHRWLLDKIREPELRAFIRAHVKPGENVLDVGSHVGLYALYFARWTKTGQVHAFEPNPVTRVALVEHVRLNGFGGRIVVRDMAVSDAIAEKDLFALPFDGMSRLGSENPELAGKTTRIRVRTTTLDDYCEAEGFAPNWLRMDIEGSEVAALRGARRLIGAGRGTLNIVVEMHPNGWKDSGDTAESCAAVLTELGLEAIPLSGQKDPLREYGIVHLAYKVPKP
jgi:FkbM family methyltransferase